MHASALSARVKFCFENYTLTPRIDLQKYRFCINFLKKLTVKNIKVLNSFFIIATVNLHYAETIV